MKKSKKSKLIKLMSTTVFLNKPETTSSKDQYDEDLCTIAKWMVKHRNKIIDILDENRDYETTSYV